MDKLKVLLITNIPTPYRIPLFNELDRQLREKGLQLKIVFGALGYDRRKWKIDMSGCSFDYEVLPSLKISYSDPEKVSFTYAGLFNVIKTWNPSVVITNAFSVATIKLWLRSWYGATPYIIWSGAVTSRDDTFLRRLHRTILVGRASGFIAYGTKAKDYLISLSADPAKIEMGINTVDTIFFHQETEKVRQNSIPKERPYHLLYVGHLSPRKNVIKLLHVVKALSESRRDFVLDVVGDGEDRGRLEAYAAGSGISGAVRFHGFKQKSEIPFFMTRANCFLFQTDFDIWGLVLVEAMSAGLPCIASVHAGATPDLIRDGVTGFAADFSNIRDVTAKINRILDDEEFARQLGENARTFIQDNINLKKSSEGFVRAVMSLLEEGIH